MTARLQRGSESRSYDEPYDVLQEVKHAACDDGFTEIVMVCGPPPPSSDPYHPHDLRFFCNRVYCKKKTIFFLQAFTARQNCTNLQFFCTPVLPKLYNLVFQVGTY